MKNKVSDKLKRFASYMLVLLMFFFNFAFFLTVKAVGTPTLTIGSQSASNGDSISVPLTANDFIDVGSMTFKVNYDNSHLTYTGYTLVSIDSEDTTVNNPGSKVSVVWEDLNNPLNLEEAVIMTINFNVISEESIESNVTFSNTEIGDNTGEELPSIFTPGVITLNPDETAPEITTYTLQVSGEEITEANNVIFSPNDDGIKDTVTIDLAFSEEVDYEINIKSGENAVKSWSGQATNPNAKIWNGEGSVGDGIYTIEVIIIDEAENSVTDTSKTITLDTTAPVITLNGINPVTIEVGVAYNDAGAAAVDNIDGDISGSINKGGNTVNQNTLGTYIITYNITDRAGNSAAEITRTVNVVDTTVPVITLIGNNTVAVEVGYEYNDAGATASDNYDGNITGNIIIVNNVNANVVGTYAVTYNVSDLSGNPAAEVVRTVNITPDATAPVITLNGGNKSIYQGTTYTDSGAAALDNIDGDISANIVTTGLPIDTAIPGAYIITYNVSDMVGNPAVEITRTVNVLPVAESQALIQEEMILDAKAPEIMIGDNAPIAANINVSSTIANAQLNFSALVSGDTEKSAIIPSNLTINSDTIAGKVSVQIPQGAQVSGDSSWTGKINLPQAQENSSVNVIPNSGYAAQVSAVIEIGFGDILLNFDKAVRIKIDNQASKYIGYSRSGVFTPITNVCSNDSQTAGDALPTAGDCKIDVGSDLIVWTKHFTKFAVYTQTAIPAPISNGGSVFVAPFFTAPIEGLSIAINGGAKTTNSENVVLTLNGGNNAQRMAISNSPDFAGSSQESYVATKNWTLSKGDGNKTVYVKFYNSYGSPSAVVSASIQLSAQLAPAPADVIAKTPAPIQAILGIKTYNDGTLLRGSDKRIYLVNNGKLQYIANLKELAKYIRKEILNVKDDVIASYGPAVLGAKEYADNSLIRGSDQKIYVIINRKKKHVASFDDLRKNYFNQVINNVSDSVLNQY